MQDYEPKNAIKHPELDRAVEIVRGRTRNNHEYESDGKTFLCGDSDKDGNRNERCVEAGSDCCTRIEFSSLENVIHYVCVYL